MKKVMVRGLAGFAVLAFAVSVAAQTEGASTSSTTTIACTKSGMTCGSGGQCCSKSCSIPHGRVVGHCH
jgi:hypothetical protein